jgi:hypothetical protein
MTGCSVSWNWDTNFVVRRQTSFETAYMNYGVALEARTIAFCTSSTGVSPRSSLTES